MALAPGTRLGQYEILDALGAGGMGEVYRARDGRLRRDVAIKVLPAELMGDPERRQRFLREARASAAVNHPNIATVHEVDEADGHTFIAMELVEGETLRARLQRGGLAIPEVLRLGTELAEGMAHAHAGRIIHRDLKPENIIIRLDGHPKILDFGLAKLLEPPEPVSHESRADTATAAMKTREGHILGTPAYMSPEQARGDALDARSDIFSLGSVLYEMAAGRAPFAGRSALDVLGSILRDRPSAPSDQNREVPSELDRIVGKCLEKSPEDRYQHADELAVDLRKLRRQADSSAAGSLLPATGVAAPQAVSMRPVRASASFRPGLVVPILAVTLLVGGGLGWLLDRLSSSDAASARPIRRFEIDIGKALPIYDWSIVTEFALSPDGTRIAYVAHVGETRRLYLRRLDQVEPVPLPGTEDALAPFFSPDGQWVAFYASDSVARVNELRKAPVDGGPPQVLCNAWPPGGGTWLSDGTILFTSTEPFTQHPVWDGSVRWGLFEIGANGGTPRPITSIDRSAGGEVAHSRPSHLPDGRGVLFTIRRTGGDWARADSPATEPDWKSATADVALLDRRSGDYRVLVRNAHGAMYSPSGHILFMRDGSLWAAPFDPGKGAISETERVVRENLQSMVLPEMNRPYALDARGSALFLPAADVAPRGRALVWVGRDGARQRVEAPPANLIETPRVSPDGERILYVVQSRTGDVWVHERARPGSQMRLTYDDTDDRRPVWFPDSRQFLYMDRVRDPESPVGFVTTILFGRADGAGSPEPWPQTLPPGAKLLSFPMVVLSDGQTVLYQEGGSARTLWDIADSSRPYRERYIVQSPAEEEDPVLSRDGKWLAYSALESGSRDIYVRPYPDTKGGRWKVTSDGGSQPLWAPDGSELYYRKGNAMMAVPIQARPQFRAGAPVKLFEGEFLNPDGPRRDYDLEYPDGRRFLMVEEFEPDVPDTRLVFVESWDRELERLVPAR